MVLLTLIFFPFELLAPAEGKQPFSKRLINILYVPLFLALAVLILQPLANAAASRIFTVRRFGDLYAPRFPRNSRYRRLVYEKRAPNARLCGTPHGLEVFQL